MNKQPTFRDLFGSSQDRRAWVRYWVIDVASGLFDIAIHSMLRMLPTDVSSWVGTWLVPAVVKCAKPEWIDQTTQNYQTLFPEMDAQACRSQALLYWRTIGRAITEISVYHRFWDAGRITLEDDGALADANASGRPVVVISLHLGNWDLGCVVI